MFDGGETMSNDNGRPASGSSLDCLLNNFFRLTIKCGSSLIEYQDLWIRYDSSCNCNSLLLSARQKRSSISYLSMVSQWHMGYKFMSICNFGSVNNLLHLAICVDLEKI